MEKQFIRYVVIGQKEGDIASYNTDLGQNKAETYARQNVKKYDSRMFGDLGDGILHEITSNEKSSKS